MVDSAFVAGRGLADITGEAAECGMLGYGRRDQVSDGIHQRLWARAYVLADARGAAERGPAGRVLIVVCDLPLMFQSVHDEVLRRLLSRFGPLYTVENVMLTVTHTHCAPGGYSGHFLYNSNTGGFRPLTFGAIVEGILEAVERAHIDVAPATLTVTHGELADASANRSPQAFARNPECDRAFFPRAIDPQTTLLRIERAGVLVGAINWFATHGTSLTNRNTLISGDNKGFAAYWWQRQVTADDGSGPDRPVAITAFAQTNSGDMSPNVSCGRGRGPTEDEFENTRIIGLRQANAAASLADRPGPPLDGGVDFRLVYVDMPNQIVRPDFSGDGLEHRTGAPAAGVAAFAGTDEGPGSRWFHQGRNPLWDRWSRDVVYRLSPRLRATHSPKGLMFGGNLLTRVVTLAQERVPVQLLRIGRLYLLGIPGEPTIVAGLRLRRTVASIVGADVRDVLAAGYSNDYIHYITTPEEYDAQRYEGASTLFGRWELPALQQVAADLARAMRDGRPLAPGGPAPEGRRPPSQCAGATRRRPIVDEPWPGRVFGEVVGSPPAMGSPGDRVQVEFVGAHPNNNLHRGGTYIELQRSAGASNGEAEDAGGPWQTVADDSDWSTKFRWARVGRRASRVTVTWDVPAGIEPGRYRLCYHGDARRADGSIHAFTGVSPAIVIS
jgi:neutral ceramidase